MKAEAQSSCSKSETERGTKYGTGNSSSTICLAATLKCKTEAKELAEGLRSWKSDRGLANFSATGAVRCRWPSLSATTAEMNDRMTARANVCLSFQMNDIWLGHCGKIYTLENLWKICKEWELSHWPGINSEGVSKTKKAFVILFQKRGCLPSQDAQKIDRKTWFSKDKLLPVPKSAGKSAVGGGTEPFQKHVLLCGVDRRYGGILSSPWLYFFPESYIGCQGRIPMRCIAKSYLLALSFISFPFKEWNINKYINHRVSELITKTAEIERGNCDTSLLPTPDTFCLITQRYQQLLSLFYNGFLLAELY